MNNVKEKIRMHAFFQDMRSVHLALLAEGASEADLMAGEVLFREGEPADRFYLIESGRVTLETHDRAGTAAIQEIGPGEVVGWSWLFPPFVWHFRARAVEPTHVIMLQGAHLLVAAERDHDFGYEVMKRVARVVIRRLQATRKALLAQQAAAALEG